MATIPNNFIWATGRRKSSVARVRITDGKGKFTVNERQVDEFFRIPKDASLAQLPLRVAEMIKKLDVHAKVHGGGTTGQSGAIAHGLARAILKLKKPTEGEAAAPAPVAESEAGAPAAPEKLPISRRLKKAKLLTRDARMKERKKYGRKGARRGFQFSKR
ncbi:MAG TPA: 30S ribosomal protein S9 [Gemmatales bacterium]|nr:30S ribosomal protein S9 [Gemmatales bacterium]